MAIIKKSKKYLVRVRDVDGQWLPSQTFETMRDAKDHEAELLASRNKGTKARKAGARDYTFGDYWGKWSLEFRERTSDGWKMSQDQMYRDHVPKWFKEKPLIEIDRSDVSRVLLFCKEKGLGNQTRIHVWSLLHKMFEDAVEELEILDSNPVRKSLRPENPVVVRDFLKPKDAIKFLHFVRDDYVGPAIWIMTYCGLRISEVQGLEWKSVDLEKSELFIGRQWSRKEKRFKPPKGKKTLHVPMPCALVNYLSVKKPIDAKPDDLVMRNQKDGGVVHYDTIEDGLKRLCKAGGFPALSPHELRHTCSELWIEDGATEQDIKRLFNHSSETSVKPYIHRTEERLTRVSRKVGPSVQPLRLVKH